MFGKKARERAQEKAELKASKPRFSERMRRWDPSLAREDRNAVYQAFRVRRLTHKKKIGLMLQGAGSSHAGGAGGVAAFAAFGVLGYLIARQLQTRRFSKPVSKGDVMEKFTMPLYASNLFGERLNVGAAVDIWMTGANGYDIAEAMYLEHREFNFWSGPIVSVFLFLLIASLGSVVVPGHWIAKAFYVVGVALFFGTLGHLCLVLGGTGAIRSMLQQQLMPMIRGNNIFPGRLLTRKWFMDFLKGTVSVFGALILLCLIGFIMAWIGFAISWVGRQFPSRGDGATMGYVTIGLGAMMVSGLALWFTSFQCKKQEKTVHDGLRQLGYVMDICLAKMADEMDGQRIAQQNKPVPMPLVRLLGADVTAEKLGMPIEVEAEVAGDLGRAAGTETGAPK